MKIQISNLGNTVQGNLFDCSKRLFIRDLKNYDKELYLKWNPKKLDGLGIWEVWRNPTKKTAIDHGEFMGGRLYTLEYKPNNFEHHVKDLDFLSYDFMNDLRKMDMWADKHYLDKLDNAYDDIEEKAELAEEESIKYAIKHNKKLFKEMHEYTKSGINPLDFFRDGRKK